MLPLFKENVAGNVPFITSSITPLEVLVKPLRDGDAATAQQYKDILTNSSTLRLFDVDAVIADEAAKLRALYNFRTPDSIQLAVAVIHGADCFLTNDKGLKRAAGIKVVTLEELS